MGSRTWIKIYCGKWLEGSLRQEKPALRGIWTDLLALCGDGSFSHLGQIKVRNDVGFTDSMLARVLNISPKMWHFWKKRLIETGRLEVNSGNVLTIKNWVKYQSEYERQKPQRTKSATKSAGLEVDHRLKSIDNRIESIPDFIDKELWTDFLEMRKKMRKPPTGKAVSLLLKDLEKYRVAGDDPNEILRQSIKNSWAGVFPLKGGQDGAHRGHLEKRRLPETYRTPEEIFRNHDR